MFWYHLRTQRFEAPVGCDETNKNEVKFKQEIIIKISLKMHFIAHYLIKFLLLQKNLLNS